VVLGVAAFALGVRFTNRAVTSEPIATVPDPTFLETVPNATAPAGTAPEGMVWIPGGEFSMGAKDPEDMNDAVGMQATRDSRPIHRVYVEASGWTGPR
jgi:formylglycine-generating enzyme required for sulfatase activity